MQKWHYYVAPDGTGYWSIQPPIFVHDRYLAYRMSETQPTGLPTQS